MTGGIRVVTDRRNQCRDCELEFTRGAALLRHRTTIAGRTTCRYAQTYNRLEASGLSAIRRKEHVAALVDAGIKLIAGPIALKRTFASLDRVTVIQGFWTDPRAISVVEAVRLPFEVRKTLLQWLAEDDPRFRAVQAARSLVGDGRALAQYVRELARGAA